MEQILFCVLRFMFHVSCFMIKIVPAIIAKSFEELERKIKLVEPYVKSVQIDIMDGIFVPNITWNNPEELKNIETELNTEVHLMVEDVERETGRWLDSGVGRILVHFEALASEKLKAENEKQQQKIKNLINKCQEHGIELGIALNLETPVDVLDKICQCESAKGRTKQSRRITAKLFRHFTPRNDVCAIDVVQLMSIEKIGAHGYPFSENVIPKIKILRQKYPGVKIEVDGGINLQNARLVAEAGADVLVIGSAIFENENIEETIKEFKNIIN